MYSMGQTHVASTAPAMQPADMAVNGLLDFLVAIFNPLVRVSEGSEIYRRLVLLHRLRQMRE